MKRRSALVLVIGLFVVGVVVGALGTHLFHSRTPPRPGLPGEPGGFRFIERLERELALTAEQRERIDEIMRESRAAGDALHEEMLPRVRQHMEETRVRIREVLDEEQQVRFDELSLEHRDRAERFFLGRGPGRGHGHGRHGGGRRGGFGDPPPPPPAPED